MGAAFSALRRRPVTASAMGFVMVVFLARMLGGGKSLQARHLKVLLEDLQAGRVAHLEFGEAAILVYLKAAELKGGGGGARNALAYGVPLLPFMFKSVSSRITALMMEQGVSYSEIRRSLAQRLQFLIVLLPFAYLIAMYFVMKRIMNPKDTMGKNLLVKKSLREKRLPTFADVAGIESAKVEMRELVSMLRNPQEYRHLGASVPKGYLLVGPSGTGKTLLAKAVAGEANAAFFQCTASDFVETLVGRGAARVRELFEKATSVRGPAIVFIDELDALGKKRGQLNSHDEREQTLNQLLTSMDGFEANVNTVVVIAATNRVDVLDPALIRPGRFDTHIHVGLCDQRGREAILRVHLKKIRSVPRLNVSTLASRTEGFSGADLAALVQDATRLAARRRCDFVGEAEFEVALQRARARFGAPQSGDDENFPFDYDGGNRNRNGNGRRRFSLDLNSILRAFGGGSDFNDQPRTSSPLRTSPAPDTPLDDGHPASPLSHGPPVQ